MKVEINHLTKVIQGNVVLDDINACFPVLPAKTGTDLRDSRNQWKWQNHAYARDLWPCASHNGHRVNRWRNHW